MKLTPAQQHAKDRLRRAREAQKTARSAFEAEMEIAWRERSAQVNQAVLEAVQEAVRLAVPKTQIGQAYGTKDYNTIKAVIEQVVTKAKAHVQATVRVIYDLKYPDQFSVLLHEFNDWTDPDNTDTLTGNAEYWRTETGNWFPEEHTTISRAVERELWRTSPLRTEVEKVVPLDSVPEVDEDGESDTEWLMEQNDKF